MEIFLTYIFYQFFSYGIKTVSLADMTSFFAWAATGLILMAFANKVITEVILSPGNDIGEEIAVDQNQAAAWLSVAGYQAMAWIFVLAI